MLISLRAHRWTVCIALSLGSVLPSASAQPGRLDNPSSPGAMVRINSMGPNVYSGVRAIVFSPDGKQLAAVGSNGHLHLWQTATGKEAAFTRNEVINAS